MRIEFERITLDVPGHRALDAVSGAVPAGSVTAVIGPSGAGKSSLLGILAGLIHADSGAVRFDGDEVTGWTPERRRLGVVFQDLRLFDFLSARDNVGFGPRVAGIAADEQRRRVDEALQLMRATDFAHRPARVLSGGERQRIALARALAIAPRGLLLDEPFSSLDADLRRSLRNELRELVTKLGVTTVIVTHDRDDAFALAGRFIVLRRGHVEQCGDATALYEAPVNEFVATLLGEATLLQIEAREGDRGLVRGQWLQMTGQGGRALLRPEKLKILESPPGWPASLVDARFVGSSWRLTFDLNGAGKIVALADHPPSSARSYIRLSSVVHSI